VRQLGDQAGEVDVLINNAAILNAHTTLEQDLESFGVMFDVDVRAPFFLAAAVLPGMITRGSGVIVNISSMAASVGVPQAPVVAATKAAIESFTRSWSAAFGTNGIRVNTVAPGPTLTDGAVAMLGEGAAQLGMATPLGRSARPSEIAEAILFVASPQASYLSGATVAVDGGFTAI
jgi:NAD(P)-dependent dehydrogenase (short-subunit alcohol dehydrogenase family)